MGKLIVIDGLDGSGKATQAQRLAETLRARALPVREVSFPDYSSPSNAIHQCSKLPESRWAAYLDWLFDYEYRLLGIPAPDLVVYLRVDPAVSQKLLEKRYGGDAEKKDVHEKDLAYLERCQAAAAYCADYLGWKTVECCRDGAMRSVEEIGEELLKAAEETLY